MISLRSPKLYPLHHVSCGTVQSELLGLKNSGKDLPILGLVWLFNGISTFVDYLVPKPSF